MKSWCTRLLILFFSGVILTATAIADENISLTVDATALRQKLLHVHLLLPVKPGSLTLYYPKWIPGEHGPDGPIANLTGLKFQADGKTIPWQRDLLDVFTFHVEIPGGVSHLDASYDYLEPDGGSATEKLLVLEWNEVVLYPAGVPAEKQMYKAELLVPEGWKVGTALPVENESGNRTSFKPISLDLLVDSPIMAGEFYRAIDLTPPGEPIHHEMDVVADSEDALNLSPENQKQMTSLVAESGQLFGSRHYRDYHFLLALSDHVAHFGLEHHESNDSRLPERTFLLPSSGTSLGGLLAHEFAHSWSGKFRRPSDLTPPYYQQPMKTDLLWDYEGMTDYAGPLLAARSGLWTPEHYREHLAGIAAALGPGRPGRTWRSLLDTAVGEPGLGFGRGGWLNWRRGTDYYDEGDLLWLEVATILHRESGGKKSIDDFCQAFYGGPNRGPEVKTYTFDDVVSLLNTMAPFDWAAFFRNRLNSTSADAPTGGIENGGWKIAFNTEPSKLEGRRSSGDLYSIGLNLSGEGTVTDSVVGSPAFEAGISSQMKIIGVNGRPYTSERLADAIKTAKDAAKPIVILVLVDDYFRTCTIHYHGGERYPHLVRDNDRPDYLDELAKPRAAN